MMANTSLNPGSFVLFTLLLLVFLPSPVAAFGAGNIPSISQIEGLNFRHGGERKLVPLSYYIADSVIDIEDMLKTVAFIKGHKWTSMMVKRVGDIL